MFLRILAPSGFVAGAECDTHITHCAPIVKYMIGWGLEDVLFYCDRRGWTIEILDDKGKRLDNNS